MPLTFLMKKVGRIAPFRIPHQYNYRFIYRWYLKITNLFYSSIEMLAITLSADTISYAHRCNLHTVAITLLALLAHCTGVNNLREYSAKLIDARSEEAPQWLHTTMLDPQSLDDDCVDAQRRSMMLPHLYIDKLALVECLQNADMESNRLTTGTPYTLYEPDTNPHRHSWVGDTVGGSTSKSGIHRSGRTSLDDITGASLNGSTSGTVGCADLESSVNSSPILPRRAAIALELNFDAMKRTLSEPTDAAKREQRERNVQLSQMFREASFDELVRRTEPRHEQLQNRLNDLFTALAVDRQIQAQTEFKTTLATATTVAHINVTSLGAVVASEKTSRERPIYEQSFPELFYY